MLGIFSNNDFVLFKFTGDMRTLISSLNTFILSNIAPQYSLHNNRSWNDWEKYARERAKEEGVLYVITGVTGQLKLVIACNI